jgi:hypothetical protein
MKLYIFSCKVSLRPKLDVPKETKLRVNRDKLAEYVQHEQGLFKILRSVGLQGTGKCGHMLVCVMQFVTYYNQWRVGAEKSLFFH